MTKDEFYAMPKISSYFPLTFETSTNKWTQFVVECAECKKDIGDEDTHGYVFPILKVDNPYRGYPILAEYHVIAQALCQLCEKLTTADYTLRQNMTLTGRDGKGNELTWNTRKLTLWEKIKDRFFK